jgi:hypothetical protein
MGVIPINFSPEVEVFIKGNRAGTRSAVVDRVMKKYLQARLGDETSALIDDSTIQQLTAACIARHQDLEQWNQDWMDQAMVLRGLFIKHLEGKQ